ncbi:MAG: MFS transporter [Planctomycetota bacterium]
MRSLLRLYRDAFGGVPLRVWLICVVAFVNRAGTMVAPFLTLWLTEELHHDADAAGRLLIAFGVGSVAGSWVGGPIARGLGGVPAMALSLFTTGLALLALGHMRSDVGLLCGLFAVGACGDAFRPASFAMLAANAPPEVRTKSFALLRLAVNLGWAIGPTVGGKIAELDYAWLFPLDALSSFYACMFLLCVGHRLMPIDAAHGEDQLPDRSPWRDARFVCFAGTVLVLAMVFLQFAYTLPLQLTAVYGLSPEVIGHLLGLNAVVIVLFEMVLVHGLRGQRPLRLCATGALFIGIAFGIVGLGSSWSFAVLVVVLWTIGEMLESPQAMVWTTARAGARSRARYVATISAMWSVAALLAPWLGTWMWQRVGAQWLWASCFVCASGAALVQLIIDRREVRDGR